MANSSEDAPLATGTLAGSEEALVLPGRPRRDSNSRALKVAGLTTLACLLLASQIFTAYMVFGQKDQIHNLQRNSERMSRELTRSSQGPVKMTRSMSSFPMMMAFSPDADYKPRITVNKVKETVVSVQNQVKELLQDFHLPHFNETFMANLNGLKNQMNETEWQSFETWMQFWLIFQMAQEKPATPTAKPTPAIKTKCQTEGATGPGKIGAYKPQCDEQGRYKPVQCWHATGFCWCVDSSGTAIEGTSMRGYPDCGRASTSRQMMLAPRMSQTAIKFQDN